MGYVTLRLLSADRPYFEALMVRARELFASVKGSEDGRLSIETGVTVHIWLSNRFMFPGNSTSMIPRENHESWWHDGIIAHFTNIVAEIAAASQIPIFVNLCPSSRFITKSVGLEPFRDIFACMATNFRKVGAMVTTTSRVWDHMFAVQGSPWTSKKGKHYNAIWAVMEKQLTKERTSILCSMNNAVIKELIDTRSTFRKMFVKSTLGRTSAVPRTWLLPMLHGYFRSTNVGGRVYGIGHTMWDGPTSSLWWNFLNQNLIC